MRIAEDRAKIARIVDGSFNAFDALYSPIIQVSQPLPIPSQSRAL